MNRGFITIATGKDIYYQVAKNLLLSYKLSCPYPYPFAIMCDRENSITALFDRVVLLDNPLYSYWDKLALLKLAPFDETIFIDADCLAYSDLNQLWDYFENAPDFAGSGTNFPIDDERGIFLEEGLCEYRGRVHWKPHINGGFYFIRRGPLCDKIYEDCMQICSHYDDFRFADYVAYKGDESVLSIAMAANGIRSLEPRPANIGIPWMSTEMTFDIFTGTCAYATQWHAYVPQGLLVHFGTRYCEKPHYLFEIEKLDLMLRKQLRPGNDLTEKLSLPEKLLYQCRLRLRVLQLVDLCRRLRNKLRRILNTPSTR